MVCAAEAMNITLLKVAAEGTTKAAEMSSKFAEEILCPLHGLVHDILPGCRAGVLAHSILVSEGYEREVQQATTGLTSL